MCAVKVRLDGKNDKCFIADLHIFELKRCVFTAQGHMMSNYFLFLINMLTPGIFPPQLLHKLWDIK